MAIVSEWKGSAVLMNRAETALINSPPPPPPRRWLQRLYGVPVLLRVGGRHGLIVLGSITRIQGDDLLGVAAKPPAAGGRR